MYMFDIGKDKFLKKNKCRGTKMTIEVSLKAII